MKKTLIVILVLLFTGNELQASHMAGGEIWYTHLADSNYKVHLRLYRDCSGINAPSQIGALFYRSLNLGISSSCTMQRDTVYANNTCPDNSCNNVSSPNLGIEVHEYSCNVVFTPATDWEMQVTIGARNNAYNIPGGNFYVRATLDNLNAPNNASYPFAPINMRLNASAQNQFNFPMLDPDSDSLVVSFSYCYDNLAANAFNPQILNYINGTSLLNPFNSLTPPILSANTGNITLFPCAQGNYSFAILIEEYRDNRLVGSAMRDYLFSMKEDINMLPYISGINGTNDFDTTIVICPSANLSFTINSLDPNLSDSTFLFFIDKPDSSSFIITNAQNQSATFNWSPKWSDARATPHILSVKVKDDQCSEQSYGFSIFVDTCQNVSTTILEKKSNIILSPNPVAANAILQLDLAGSNTINMTAVDLLGRPTQLKHYKRNVASGAQNFTLPMGNLESGYYLLLIQTDKEKFSIPFCNQ